MPDLTQSLYNLRLLDNLAQRDTAIHRMHPLINLLTAVAYIVTVVSFGRYELIRMLPLLFYPILIFSLGEIPLAPILKRLLIVSPLIIGIGLLNPIFDQQPVMVGSVFLARGWLTFLILVLKGVLTVTAALLLIATMGIDNLAAALRQLRVPKPLVMQILLTYRYITVLAEELARILRAYALRAPGQRGIQRQAWGSLAGQLLLRTYDRAQRVYEAMCLRGFTGEYHTGKSQRIKPGDIAYGGTWLTFFFLVKIYNWPLVIGTWLNGVMR